jgi:PLP dependent protein
MSLLQQVARVERLIAQSALACHRSPQTILLLAASKGQPATRLREAFAAGLRHFGENYLQEAEVKMQALADLAIHWHFIGAIQRNKAKGIAQRFSWVHSLASASIARLLAKHRPNHLAPLNLCLQVNLDEEESKAGVSLQEVAPLAQLTSQLPGLKLRGLMAMPKPLADEQQQYESLLRFAKLLTQLNNELHLSMDTLSMGMSNDLVPAIYAGSTLVRIGRAIFGERLQ